MIYPTQQRQIYFIYILLCSDRSYYIGLTNSLGKRLSEHENGLYTMCYTYRKRPVHLVYFETCPFLKEATEREIQLKKWSRTKKKALIEHNFHKLQLLAQCQNLTHYMYKDSRR